MKSLRNAALVAAGAFVLAAAGASAAPAQFNWLANAQSAKSNDAVSPQQRILAGINEANLVTLAGNLRGEATAENDHGRVLDSLVLDHMQLVLQRSPDQEAALKQYIADETNPKSPNFHKWLTPAQMGDKYGVAQTDLTTVTGWLQGHGFTVNSVYRNNMVIDFTGTASQVLGAFHTEIHNLVVDGKPHIANISNPQIPAALSSVVLGVASLHNFMPHTNFKTKVAMNGKGPEYNPAFTSTSSDFPFDMVPADLATIYNITPLFNAGFNGAGQTIALIEDTDGGTNVTADYSTFRTTFGLGAGTFTTVHPPSSGTNNCTDPGIVSEAESEAQLDIEWAAAGAPGATIKMATCKDSATTFGGLLAVQNLVNSGTPPQVMSVSYGECEAANGATQNALYNTVYQQAAAAGVSIFVSSGDESSVSCDANKTAATHGTGASGFTTTPYNVSVGGTDFEDTLNGTNSTYWAPTNTATYGSALSYIPEIPWNDSCASQLLMNLEFANGVTTTSNTYGPGSLCALGEALSTGSGSGAPSGCYSGAPAQADVVGGTCVGQAKPSWQAGFLGNPVDGVRDIPDVSLFASNGWWGHYLVYCDSDTSDGGAVCTGDPTNWGGAGGTSFSSPILAGIQAVINQSAGGSQGLPNPAFYSIAAAEYGASGSASCNSSVAGGPSSSCVFYDVTQGDMNVNCKALAARGKTPGGTFNCFLDAQTNGVGSVTDTTFAPTYGTNAGWDFSTGLGTVNAFNLVTAYTGASAVSASISGSSVVLNWTAPYDAVSGYQLYQSTTSGGEGSTAVSSPASTTATVAGLAPGAYYFQVAAVNATTSATSVKSTEVSVTVPTLSTPAAFTIAAVTGAPLSTPQTSGPVTVSGINVAVPISVTGGTYSINNGTPTSTSGTVTNGQTVTVQLTSSPKYNTAVKSTLSSGGVTAVYSVTTLVLPSPTGLTGVANAGGSITLNWTASSGATGYSLFQGTSPTGISATAVQSNISGTTTTVTGLTLGTTYYFQVEALSGTNFSVKSSEAKVVLPLAPTVSISLNPTSMNTGSSTVLTWSSTSATSCVASGTPSATTWSGTRAVNGSSLTITKTGVGTFTYVLTCSNVSGTVSNSATLTVTKPVAQ